MSIRDFFQSVFREKNTGQEEDISIDKEYSSQNTFADQEEADRAFERAKVKLFDVNGWSKLTGLTSKFELHDQNGQKTTKAQPEVGDFVRILLPAPTPENWVEVIDVKVNDANKVAAFTVCPCKDPTENEEDVEHFFVKEASSKFKVELKGKTLYAYEIGKDERINNKGKEAGARGILNTFISAGGWLAFQELQWKKLTTYLVHKEEIEV